MLPGFYKIIEDQKNGEIWVEKPDLIAWHLPITPAIPRLVNDGKTYYALNAYQLRYHLKRNALTLEILESPRYSPKTVIDSSGFNPEAIRPLTPGAFINYDFTAIKNDAISGMNNSALIELGLFNFYGVGTYDMLASNYSPTSNPSQHYKATRLTTTWTLDQPEKIATWRLGDSITGASSWSGSARFGGIQYATNFSTQPTFITFPLPGFKGQAIVPTNVQIFVNGVMNQHRSLENGAYLINNIPVVTGAGNVSVVTQDLLGRTQVVNIPYYASPTLLKPGLEDYSYELGFLRQNYGINSNDYHQALLTATYLRGITDDLTLGGHGELLSATQTLGVSCDYLVKQFGILSLATAGSHSQYSGGGWLGSFGFTRQTPTINYGIKSTYQTSGYQQIGLQPFIASPLGAVSTNQLFVGYDAGYFGSLGLSYTTTKQYAAPNAVSNPGPQISEIGTLTYSRGLMYNTSLVLSAIKDFHNSDNNQYYGALVVSLDNLHSLNAFTNYQSHKTQPGLLYTRNLPLGVGYGYHVLATNTGVNGPGADFTYQNEIGTYTARAYHVESHNYYEGDVSGALVYFGEHPFLSRRMTQSFALAQVPGYPNIRVYYQNQLAGKTDANGNLLIPEILPYQENTLAIEPRDLPLTTTVDTSTTTVRPYFRSGAKAYFKINRASFLTLHLIQTNGRYVPVGSDVVLNDQSRYLVGYDGLLFFNKEITHTITGKVHWDHGHCQFKLPALSNPLNRLRTIKTLCL